MKANKKIWLLLAAVPLIFGQLGCKKFLDRTPLGQGIAGDIPQGGVEGQVFGLYGALQTWGMTQLPFLTMHAARADDNFNSTQGDGSDQQDIVDHFNYTKDHWSLNSLWSDHFAFITQASGIIFDVDSSFSNDPASQVNRAEACFLRAYAYFDMVRDYGEVPKIDFKVYQPSDANVKKSSVADIYALIDADLQYATDHLPVSWETKYLGRVTRGAAITLSAKTFLYRQNWATALSKCDDVIGSNQYALFPDYGKLFTDEQNENSVESIFEIQNYENLNGSKIVSNYLPQYQGIRGSGDWNLGWGWNLPTETLVGQGYEAGDPRKTETILYSGHPDSLYGGVLPGSPTPYWNKKVYSDPGRRAATGDFSGSWLNTIILRYADVLLMDAEAANELGGPDNTAKALADLELVRARARGTVTGVLPQITSTDQTVIRKAIKQERRAEFAMEFERFYDLVRWGDAVQVLGPQGYTDKNKYYPIPQVEIDKSQGVLVQNPDYP